VLENTPGEPMIPPLRGLALFALDAVALDTETTGLDPRKARIIELAGVAIRDGTVAAGEPFAALVSPGEPIPAASTAVHGITDADVSGAPSFQNVFRAFETFCAGRPVIGHTIGFDSAVIAAECGRIGMSFTPWPSLDVRLLAEIAAPNLPDYSLDALASWLGIDVGDRHRALADARAAAHVFVALEPKLRARGVKTLGDALDACLRLSEASQGQRAAGYLLPGADGPRADLAAIGRRLDAHAYRHRVRDVMSSPAIFAQAGDDLGTILERLVDGRISSILVGRAEDPAGEIGVLTERDLLRFLRREGSHALTRSAMEAATRPLVTVPADAHLHVAIGRMRAKNIRHLVATGTDGRVAGVLSARDLLRTRADSALMLGDALENESDLPSLAKAWATLPALAAALLDEDVPAREIAGVVAAELGALTRRAAVLAEQEAVAAGLGGPPCPYAVLTLGSAGRGESLLALDQDNAIVFAAGDPDGPEDRWFAALGARMTQILGDVGVPLCPGGVMASNPAFRGSVAEWRRRIGHWLSRADPKDLLAVDIVFDLRPVHGDLAMADALWREAWAAAAGNRVFLRLLADADGHRAAPFGLFGRLRTEEGRLDLKAGALAPLVAAGRLLALLHGAPAHGTAERFDAALAAKAGGEADLRRAILVHGRVLDLVLRAQLADIVAGRRPSNRVPTDLAQEHGGLDLLKDDLHRIADLEELVRNQLSR
jgi:CBS domain-containing protein